jgi:hypothetical protein
MSVCQGDTQSAVLANDRPLPASQVLFLGLGENSTANKGKAVAGGETLVLAFRGTIDAVASGASTPVRVQEL